MEDRAHRRAFSEEEASRYIGMSVSWLRHGRMNGDESAPPFLKIGRSVRYLRDDLDAWLEGRRRGGNYRSDPHA